MAHFTPLKFTSSSGSFFLSQRKVVGHQSMAGDHFHSNYEIFYLLAGERVYFIKDRSYHVRKGNIIFIKPFDLHTTQDTGTPNHERFLIKFNPEFLVDSAGVAPQSLELLFSRYNFVSFDPLYQNAVDRLFETMRQEIQNRSFDYENCLRSLLLQLLIFAARNTNRNEEVPHLNPTHGRISEIVKYINQNYQEKLTLSMVAGLFHVSPYYLSRSFKEVTGLTFTDYFNNLRVSIAQKMLQDSDHSVLFVANEVGFENQSYFGKLFKNITGISPLQYRKRLETGAKDSFQE